MRAAKSKPFSSSVSGYSWNEVKVWCKQTPNPQPCEYFMNNNPIHSQKIIKHKDDFLKLSLQVAQERALKGHANTVSLGPKCRNSREKAAWADCIELYEQAVEKLNKTLNPNTKFSQVDAQTWLSTALTNLETCRAGFYELGVQDFVLPLMSNNVTKLVSNTLALNKVEYKEPSHKEGFPTWVKPGDRKLLQSSSSSSRANVVVAKDGSGKYTTISAAINAAPKSSSGRYVIYVKAGTYNEQVEIKAKNIMLVGDGIGKTIITGSKSVGGGTTTFRSATGYYGCFRVKSSSELCENLYWKAMEAIFSNSDYESFLDSLINQAGWFEWSGNFALHLRMEFLQP
ncbi:pectinesterase 2-like [Neltuma alba]|uniref:pectinesterase 2-like n=1 Tax=Neltuma alba TaxID=207710 RepID=UPI0010A4A3A7|nr:pectinesterase 2-like [Prosopis alba]